MNLIIRNEKLEVTVSDAGAEMQSIRDNEGTEYLWGADPAYWTGRAPNLFPYIGRLTGSTYTLGGNPYTMGIHGFAAQKRFALEQKSGYSAVFVLRDDESTRKMYPFRFSFRVIYRLDGMCLHIVYRVENKGEKTMYFGVGGHPGFSLPFVKGLKFEDYYLEFCDNQTPVRIGLSDTCYCSGDDKPYPLKNGRELALAHSLFDDDAVILAKAAKSVTLKSRKGTKSVRVNYPDMKYLGLWQMSRTKAPYVCIEPWTSLPSRQGVIEDLALQRDLIRLPAGDKYMNEWTIEVL